MRKKLNKVKESFDKRMLQKTNKQMIWYIVVSYIIWGIGFLFILLKLDGNSIIVCLLAIIYFVFIVVMEVYLGHHQFLASLRDAEREKRNLFKNSILKRQLLHCATVVLLVKISHSYDILLNVR